VQAPPSDAGNRVLFLMPACVKCEETIPCLALLLSPVKVKALKKKFPEVRDPRRKWVPRKKAAKNGARTANWPS